MKKLKRAYRDYEICRELREQKTRIKKLIGVINQRITDIKVLKGGWIMTNKVLRCVLKEHPQLRDEWDTLHARKDILKRLLWKLP
tara:strand:+ start:576 stop:830 length:255 start_codon:yes stop_codon:yes gene_type:complete